MKVICDGAFGTGKTAFTATMAEVGPIGVCDTEQRWQFYTIPHPTEKPRVEAPASILDALAGPRPEKPDPIYDRVRAAWAGAYKTAYSYPRQIRQDKAWLPKTPHVVWLFQSMDPIMAWNVTRVWALDAGIVGIAKDSLSVYWDILQDTVDRSNEKLGGLAWTPVKRTDRRMTYTLLKSAKHWIYTAHTQDKMNAKMEVIAQVPWVEKKNPHWADVCLRFYYQQGTDRAPRAEVVREKVAGGKDDALKLGRVIAAPTFKGLLALCGTLPDLIEPPRETMEQIESRSKAAVERVAGTAYQPGIDSDPKGE